MLSFRDARRSASGFGMLGASVASFSCGMRILLDECVPWPMHKILTGRDCSTVQSQGWGGIKNGDLLQLAEDEFDLFITSDQNIRYQHT